ncbi:MAG TPA: 30S ribosomal protein S17 [Clostridia bacterium]|nr:30S ribosomal protein S17 [Clostridia bacterium]
MKAFQGKVVSNKMTKAAVVLIERRFRHPVYGKIVTKKKKIHVLNEIGAKTGQEVKIIETRPTSKTISFKITEIIGEKK